MNKQKRKELNKVIGKVEDVRTSIEERQDEADDDGTLAEVVDVLEQVEDKLEDIVND